MNCALAFCKFDSAQATRWLNWSIELGIGKNHRLWIMPAKSLPNPPLEKLRAAWASVEIVQDYLGVTSEWSASNDAVRDCSGPNSSIRQFAQHFYYKKLGPWAFIEADAIFLCQEALDRIESEYKASGKRFMGARVKVSNVPEHSTGNMVLAEDANNLPSLMLPRHARIQGRLVEIAFDVAGADEILANFHETKLIQHRFRAEPFTSREHVEAILDKEAVLYHSDKSGSICQFLREKRGGVTPQIKSSSVPLDASNAAQRVYTYWEVVPGMDIEEQMKMIELWKQAWRDAGWSPEVLTHNEAAIHPKAAEWRAALSARPTINNPVYELACFSRWIAMASVGGGLMLDYDVMPNGFTLANCMPPWITEFPLLWCAFVPCAVVGTKKQYENAVEAFITCPPSTEKGVPHLSDMHACQTLKFPAVDLCREYNTPGWEKAPLIHFCHGRTAGAVRSKLIKEWLDGKVWESRPGGAVALFTGERSPLPVIEPLHAAPTIVGQFRHHIEAIKKVIDGSKSRHIIFAKELRKAALIPQGKKRKRRDPFRKLTGKK